MVLCQNHVKGEVVPRDEDRELTGKVRDALALFGIQLLDHIFVSNHDPYSLAEYELLWFSHSQVHVTIKSTIEQ